ncbi:MAG TPA: flavodoxin [Lachnospiraceae bacterium]|nr:flavodoxin [Lachnospiraceae bacterium]
MKRMISILLSAVLAFSLTACGTESNADPDRDTENTVPTSTEEQSNSEKSGDSMTEKSNTPEDAASSQTGSRILIAYFSIPEDVSTEGADAVAGASIVVSEEEKLGNTQYVAEVIQDAVGGDLFRIETVEEYPLDHDPLVDQAAEEQDADLRPVLASHVENFEQYETVILGFPNWWGDLPMPVYSFLEEYDFGAKTIIPFVTHGGSGFSNTLETISSLQPEAHVSDDTLSLSRNDVAESRETVISWAESLGLN